MLTAIGECMVEVAPDDGAAYRLGYAGDTFNAAWAARLLLPRSVPVRYVTAIGTDWMSDGMLDFIVRSGIDGDYVRRDPDRTVGLYAVKLVDGERSFAYWRRDSAATALAEDPSFLAAALAGTGIVLVSGITLAILPADGRASLLTALSQARHAGARIAFDPNYRPRLWPSAAAARASFDAIWDLVDIALPGFDDEAALYGDASPAATAERLRGSGIAEIVVKDGAGPALCATARGTRAIASHAAPTMVDSTGAGDAFNGAYLSARLLGMDPEQAVLQGHRIASIAVQSRGALVPAERLSARAEFQEGERP